MTSFNTNGIIATMKINTEAMTIRIPRLLKDRLKSAKWEYKCSENELVIKALSAFLDKKKA